MKIALNRVRRVDNRWLRLGYPDGEDSEEKFYSVRESSRYQRSRGNPNSSEPLAIIKVEADNESELYEIRYSSDLVSLLCELGGLAVILGFLGRSLTSFIS